MNEAPKEPDWIATCQAVAKTPDGKRRTVWIALGRPREPASPGITWYCPVLIRVGGKVWREDSIAGTDGVESLTYALVALADGVEQLRKTLDVRFYGGSEFAPEAFLLRRLSPGSEA